MAEVADCCGCCLLFTICLGLCGRACLWIPCPGDRKRAKEFEDDEMYAHQVAQEEYLRRAQKPSHYSADYRGPPQPQGQDPMVVGGNPWTSDPNLPADQSLNNMAGRGIQRHPPSQPPDALQLPPASYQGQQAHQYPPLHDPRASSMSGATLQGTEEPGRYSAPRPPSQDGRTPNGIGHRSNRSGQYSQQDSEMDSARRSEGPNDGQRQPVGYAQPGSQA
ncbi:hypothetical protein HYPSUDRAFT_82308 [Hypholoma sublateritium FD-334 SS-4]|uniref:Uncharacterized protein n=1 Tax=Hypholoma sublateritium (strain FD-334 SS-4) TaxID=945553 RepID=A0A0D2PD29_HYPSF|nr:hypothetical protein HYPSUDRAFT_82308 [Hypholoma sublateritium FD-334 SS-4]